MPLARVVAQYQNELPKFFKRYQIQPVWRADRPARGRFREFYQCDIDAIGSTSPVVEAEMLGAVSEVLDDARVSGFHDSAEPPAAADGAARDGRRARSARTARRSIALDKLDKIGEAGVADRAERRGHQRRRRAGAVLALVRDCRPRERWPRLGALVRRPRRRRHRTRGIECHRRDDAGGACSIRIDPSLARGLSYYTGAIMEIAVPDLAGSLGGGGRYDNLIGMFLGRDVPACGFSLGLERIIVVMTEREDVPGAVWRGAVDVMVTFWIDDSRADALALAADLRSARPARATSIRRSRRSSRSR